MNDFWYEEDTESDKAAFEYYDRKLHEKENALSRKKRLTTRFFIILGIGLFTILAVVLGLVFGLKPR